MSGEDRHLEEAYEDRSYYESGLYALDKEEADAAASEGLEPEPLDACQRCNRPGSLYDGEFYIGNEVVCWPCKDHHMNPPPAPIPPWIMPLGGEE